MPKIEIALTENDDELIRQYVDSGRFESASELLHVALSLVREDERDDAAKLDRLRRLAKVGFDALDRGDYDTIEPGGTKAYFDGLVAERHARATAQR